MQLILGTAQFGLGYGISGSGAAVAPVQARRILEHAAARGVQTIDTAAAYGDIEPRLGALCGNLSLNVISKLPPPPTLKDEQALIGWFIEHGERSRSRLGGRLKSLLFHRDQELLEDRGGVIWQGVKQWADAHNIRLGVSCYDPARALQLLERISVDLFQLPGNALDQRVSESGIAHRAEVHLRSPFLQGLLLMDRELAVRRLPVSLAAIDRWHEWCEAKAVSGLSAAFSIVKSFANVKACVLGVDSLEQMTQIAEAWEASNAINAPELSCLELAVIDPRTWRPVK